MRVVRTARHPVGIRRESRCRTWGCRPQIGGHRSGLRRARTAAVLVSVVAGVAGCSGGDEAMPTTSRPQLTAPEVTVEHTEPSTAASAASTAEETTEGTASSSTVDPQAAVKEEVTAALTATHQAWATCLSQMPACDTAVLADTRVDEQLAFSQDLATKWNSAGYRARNLESLTYEVEDVSVNEAGDRAVVTECSTDGVVLYIAVARRHGADRQRRVVLGPGRPGRWSVARTGGGGPPPTRP